MRLKERSLHARPEEAVARPVLQPERSPAVPADPLLVAGVRAIAATVTRVAGVTRKAAPQGRGE